MSNPNTLRFKIIGVILKTIGAVFLIALFLGFLLWLGLSIGADTKRAIILRDELLGQVHQAKSRRRAIVIDFDRLANFDWDTLWIFPGYSEYGKIAACTGYRPNLLCDGIVNEHDVLMIFTLKGRAVEHMNLESDAGCTLELYDLRFERPFSRDKAKMIVRFDSQRDNWDFYRFAPALKQN